MKADEGNIISEEAWLKQRFCDTVFKATFIEV